MKALNRNPGGLTVPEPASDERAPRPAPPAEDGAVWSHTEWDPLEEVIVGRADGATFPPWHGILAATTPEAHWETFRHRGGEAFPEEVVDAARRELDGLCRLLEGEGVRVTVPTAEDHRAEFSTPDWESPSGLYAAMPRDVLLVIGDQLIEAPMAWRCRYFEVHAYRSLLIDYFRRGARWVSAPRPMLRDDLFRLDADGNAPGGRPPEAPEFAVGEVEPTFDAADFMRFGRNLVVQQSHVTNELGIEWLRRHLGPGYRIHRLHPVDAHPMHIDATLLPLAPGKLLVNPERLPEVPPLFRDWEVRSAPPPAPRDGSPLFLSSAWVSMNLLSLDPERVLVEASETALQEMLRSWGFEPIPCPFRAFNALGGSFHCATLDVRRRGPLESYL